MIKPHLTKAIHDRVDEVMAQARAIWANHTFTKPIVVIRPQGSRAGTATYHTNTLAFNSGLIEDNLAEYLSDTVPHECAHLICRTVYGPHVDAHGYEWRTVMCKLGVEPKRTHNMDTSATKREVSKYRYVCQCSGESAIHMVGGKIHNKIQRGHTYTCRKCHSTLGVTKTTLVQSVHFSNVQIARTVNVQAPVASTTIPASIGGSKMDKARWLYNTFKDTLNRQQMLAAFIKEAGCTPAGAATYYYTLKK